MAINYNAIGSISYGFYDDLNRPNIHAGYGPYNSVEEAFRIIDKVYHGDPDKPNANYIGGDVPKGFKFAIIENGVFTEYFYKSGNAFDISNFGIGIVPVGEGGGGNGTITDVKKGTQSSSTTLVPNGSTVAYIPMASSSTDGLLSSSDKVKLDSLIEILEDGIYNVDSNFEVEGGNSESSGNITELEAKVNRIIAILGDLYNSGGNDARFEVTETV